MRYKKILIALDCTDEENNVIREAIGLASTLKAELMAVHVNDPAAGKAHMMMDSLALNTENDLRDQFRKLGFEKEANEIKVTMVESPDYAMEIAKVTKDADLLVIGHHPKNRFLAAVMDSTDERVSDLVSCPMLVVPCGQ